MLGMPTKQVYASSFFFTLKMNKTKMYLAMLPSQNSPKSLILKTVLCWETTPL